MPNRRATFLSYRPKTILNRAKRPDHWFWSRYSAHSYTGCQHGCAFCYCREQKFSPYDDPSDFDRLIRAKENVPDLLRRALSKAPVDVVMTGDYQPIERVYGLSRKMLQVCLDLGFPVLALERSPLILKDLDLLKAIQECTRAVVAFCIIYTQNSPVAKSLQNLERLAPPSEKRLAAMEKIAAAVILTGAWMMPLLPVVCDNEENLAAVIKAVRDHGGQFVLASSLTLSDQQNVHFLHEFSALFPDLLETYHQLYPPGVYSPVAIRWQETARKIRSLCNQFGVSDRMPRPIIPGEKRALNSRLFEILANQAYILEINDAATHTIWAYRKAAWAVEDLEQDIRLVYSSMGLKGLFAIPHIGAAFARTLESLIQNPLPSSLPDPSKHPQLEIPQR